MPDMQTALRSALSKTLQTWDDDGEEGTPVPVPAVAFTPAPLSTSVNSVSAPSQNNQTNPQGKPMINAHKITTNVSRETFNYIKNNPGSTRMEIITALGNKGFDKGSVSSLIAQMRKSFMTHETNGLWYADVDEYRPIKSNNEDKKKARMKKKAKAGVAGIGALLKEKVSRRTHDDAVDAASYAIPANIPTQRATVTTIVRNRTPESIVDNLTVYQARELYMHLKTLFGG